MLAWGREIAEIGTEPEGIPVEERGSPRLAVPQHRKPLASTEPSRVGPSHLTVGPCTSLVLPDPWPESQVCPHATSRGWMQHLYQQFHPWSEGRREIQIKGCW